MNGRQERARNAFKGSEATMTTIEGTLAAHAATIGDALLAASPAFVSEAELEELTGLVGYAVRWYVFQLRQAGFVVEAALTADREAFARGARGWRLVDTVAGASYPVVEPVEPVKGMRVESLAGVRGRVAFAREGFPCVTVEYVDGSREKVSRDAFVSIETGAIVALTGG
jgi:hypothetical protein